MRHAADAVDFDARVGVAPGGAVKAQCLACRPDTIRWGGPGRFRVVEFRILARVKPPRSDVFAIDDGDLGYSASMVNQITGDCDTFGRAVNRAMQKMDSRAFLVHGYVVNPFRKRNREVLPGQVNQSANIKCNSSDILASVWISRQ